MSSSPMYQKPRVSRRQAIPGNLVNNWKSSAAQGAEPLFRRPRTACERCRTAKVRCHGNGHHDCDRCASRGLPCRYTEPPVSPSPAPSSLRSPSSVLDRGGNPPEDSQMDFGGGAGHLNDQSASDSAALQQLLGSPVDWPGIDHQTDSPEHQQQHQQQQQQQQQMDWSAVDPALDWAIGMNPVAGLDLPEGFSSNSTTPPGSMGGSTTNNSSSITTPTSEQLASLSSAGLLPLITSTNAAGLSWQSQLSSEGCQCRSGLAQLAPNARAALQEGRLDGVFQVTSDIIQQCQGMVTCTSCRANCTDLICIMAVFQEADVCFDYIAKKDNLDSTISVSVGLYDMAADDQDAMQWRQMLVVQLWRRANKLLDLISTRGQAMLRDLDPDCRLGRININYLQAVIENSRDNFRRVIKEFQEHKDGKDNREETDY